MSALLNETLDLLRRIKHPHAAALKTRLTEGGVAVPAGAMPWPEIPDSGDVLLAGIAAPEGIRAALRPGRTVHLWDRSAPRMRALLESEDWRDALRTRQLRIAVDTDIRTIDPALPLVAHPLFADRYARELAWRGAAPPRCAFVVDGGLLVEECARALAAEGFAVWTWETTRLVPAALRRIATALRPERIVAVNHQPGLPEAVQSLADVLPAVRLDVWEIDPALDAVAPPARPVPATTVYTWRRPNVEAFAAAGYRAAWLPLAADPGWRRPMVLLPHEQEQLGAPVCFVGRSMVIEARRFRVGLTAAARAALHTEGLDPSSADRRIDAVLAAQRATPTSWRIPELLDEHLPGLRTHPRGPQDIDPVHLAGEIAAAELRLTVVANLGRNGIHVWGDEGWKGLERHGVRHRGPAGHAQTLPRLYNNGAIHIDIGRLYQLDIVTLRVFDVLACGGFVIAHHSADLERLFDVGTEIESWRTIDELRAKVAHHLAHPDARRPFIEAGRARVLRDHTVAARFAQMRAA